jgi:hypothetical protein
MKKVEYIVEHASRLSYHKLKVEKKLRDISARILATRKQDRIKAMTDAYHETRDLLIWLMNAMDYHRNAIIKHARSIDEVSAEKGLERAELQVRNMLNHPERLGGVHNAM